MVHLALWTGIPTCLLIRLLRALSNYIRRRRERRRSRDRRTGDFQQRGVWPQSIIQQISHRLCLRAVVWGQRHGMTRMMQEAIPLGIEPLTVARKSTSDPSSASPHGVAKTHPGGIICHGRGWEFCKSSPLLLQLRRVKHCRALRHKKPQGGADRRN